MLSEAGTEEALDVGRGHCPRAVPLALHHEATPRGTDSRHVRAEVTRAADDADVAEAVADQEPGDEVLELSRSTGIRSGQVTVPLCLSSRRSSPTGHETAERQAHNSEGHETGGPAQDGMLAYLPSHHLLDAA